MQAVPSPALVLGLAVTGEATARQLLSRGAQVIAVDDRPSAEVRAAAGALRLELVEAPSPAELARLVRRAGVVLPSPGVPGHHPVFAAAAAAGVPVWSEFELCARWGSPPLVAITGTNGKTTVTTLVTRMLTAAGLRTMDAGNTELPLVDVLDRGLDVIVVEASSFRLALTSSFHAHVGAWLNFAEDHLDWHASMEEYAAAKARVWANQDGSDFAIANADDPVVAHAVGSAGGQGQVLTFSTSGAPGATWVWEPGSPGHGVLRGPEGVVLAEVDALPRRFPHDLANALAAAAAATSAGATLDHCRRVIEAFGGLPHRVSAVAEVGGVLFCDDSKATTPASVLAAVRGFDSVVLIAGGRNKGTDLRVLRETVPPVHAVVAFGEAAAEVEEAFSNLVPVAVAAGMDEAVEAAMSLARPGDTVLLSPACASFDAYVSYAERGDDFVRAVKQRCAR